LLPTKQSQETFTPTQLSSYIHHNMSFPMLKEHLVDAIDELVSVSNRHKINSLIEKFDTEATKVHRMMQQAQQNMVTTHTECVNTVYDVLSRHDNGDVDDNANTHDEGKDAEALVVDDNMQQTTIAAMEDPCIVIRL
jgi:hypothetical protein